MPRRLDPPESPLGTWRSGLAGAPQHPRGPGGAAPRVAAWSGSWYARPAVADVVVPDPRRSAGQPLDPGLDQDREPGDVPIEELSVEPPPVDGDPGAPERRIPPPTPPRARGRPRAGDGASRPAPARARAAIPHRGRDAGPAAPRGGAGGLGGSTPPPSSAGGVLPADPALGIALARARSAAQLSPKMTAIFGGLFGLATVTSIVALLIQVVPPRDDRAVIASTSAAPSASSEAAPIPTSFEHKKKQRTPVPGPWRLSELAKDPSATLASATIDRRSFVDALAEKGVPKAQAYRIMKAFEGTRKFDKCGRKDKFSVAMDRTSRRVKAFEYEVSPSEIYQAREGKEGLLEGARLDLKIAEEEVVSAFYVGSDRVVSYQFAGLEDGILATIDEALNGRMSSESFEEGATVRFIAVEETALGMFSRYKSIVALEYRPPDPAAKPVRVYSFKGAESRGYFDERGRQPYAGGWRSPIPGAPVTSRFNPKRMHPVLHKVMPHTGTDFGAPMGTPVYAAYKGVVESVGPAGPAGNLVMITHPNGVSTGYAHLSRFAPGIKHGDPIGVHQLVGYVGSTGRSTGPHLHFIAKKDGKFFDAETLQLDGERVLPAVDRAAFLAAKADLDKRLDAIPLPEPPPERPKPGGAGAGSASAEPAAGGSRPAAQVPGAGGPVEDIDGGIHPSSMIEDDSEDDGEQGTPIQGAPLGPSAAPNAPPAPSPGKQDPAEEDDGENE